VSNPSPIPAEAATATGAGHLPVVVATAVAAAFAPFPTETIPPEPIKTVHLPYERATMLANLPRGRWSEGGTPAAFTGMIAALPSAVDALIHACKRSPFSLEGFELVQLLICFGFLVWLIVSLFYSLRGKTSLEYLNELYPPPKANPNAANTTQ
jgi:hypothetical protein